MIKKKFEITSRIPSYVRRLEIMYRGYDEKIFHEIIRSASIFVQEELSYDNWDGGSYGHGIILFLDEETISKIKSFQIQQKICQKILEDFRECAKPLPNEGIDVVSIELFDDGNPDCKSSIKTFAQPVINPDSLDIWEKGYIRLFISHRDGYKNEALHLAELLKGYGISSFVAHDTITPMEEWQHVIKKGLQTMEIMLAFITDDFFESDWTNQEIGVALGRGINIIPLKLQKTDPQGFINHIQAIKSVLDSPEDSVEKIYKALVTKLGQEERIRKSVVQAFVKSPDFNETASRFRRVQSLTTITDSDIQQIIEGYAQNDQLHNAAHLHNHKNQRLLDFLKNRTAKDYQIDGKVIRLSQQEEEDLPF